jgi:glycosyltransferase involved in cell wall biosynthesis
MQSKPKILFFTDCFIFGGCEIVLTNLVNSKTLNSEFELLYSYRNFKEYDLAVREKVSNVKLLRPINLISNSSFFYSINLTYTKWLSNIIKFPFYFLSKIGIYSFINFFVLYRLFVNEKPDVLFINNGGYPGSEICRLAVFAAKASQIKKVVFNVNNLAFSPKFTIDKLIDRFLDKNVTYFLTASKAAKNRLSEARGFSINKIINIQNSSREVNFPKENSILREEFNLSAETIVLGSVGLLTKRKGFSLLLRSFKKVLENDPTVNCELFIFGEGEERSELDSLILLLGLQNRVHMPGYKNDVLKYINDFDVFVLPSLSNEDMPYVLIESMMLKKPVIGTKVAGIPEEIINGETGIIVMPDNEVEMVEALHVLIKDKSLRFAYGQNGYVRFKDHFSYDVVIEKYNKFFHVLFEK